MHYVCGNNTRRWLVEKHNFLNGIDYLEIDEEQSHLRLHFLNAHNLVQLELRNFQIDSGENSNALPITGIEWRDSENIITIETEEPDKMLNYTLKLVMGIYQTEPPEKFDPVLSLVDFAFLDTGVNDFDCKTSEIRSIERFEEPLIDYLAKDYSSFRQLMLDRLAVTIPNWQDRNPSDLGMALVEVMAYAADNLSYFQDAVATEAYLGTARKRTSIRRHSRALDYNMHDGCNARVWFSIEVDTEDNYILPSGTRLYTGLNDKQGSLTAKTKEKNNGDGYEKFISFDPAVILGSGALIFETMHDIKLHANYEKILFYTWGDEECWLPEGATAATLTDQWLKPNIEDNSKSNRMLGNLEVGDVLLLEEKRSPKGNKKPDPAHKHIIRITDVAFKVDPVTIKNTESKELGTPVLEMKWAAEDALPFPLCISMPDEVNNPASVVRGNIVLADHGCTMTRNKLEKIIIPENRRSRVSLNEPQITFKVPYIHKDAKHLPAVSALIQDPGKALPDITLLMQEAVWKPQLDLLNSNRFAEEFVVEVEDDGTAYIRFGDNIHGKQPPAGSEFEVSYRVGNGTEGNIGAEASFQAMTEGNELPSGRIKVRNPMPAKGGVQPETIKQVQLYAPKGFHRQERAVTAVDYAEMTMRHSGVQKAVATIRWTGSYNSIFIAVDRKGGRPVGELFEDELRDFLEKYRLTGHDIEITSPRFVPLDIKVTVFLKSGYLQSSVKETLQTVFSASVTSTGKRGFFHPDNFTFGQPVYLSHLVEVGMKVVGVSRVDVLRFERWGQHSYVDLENAVITIKRLEIVRLDNDPDKPENGRIEFDLRGGL